MYGLKIVRVVAAAFGIVAVAAGTAAAQVCMGFPTARGQAAVAVNASFPTGSNDFGVEGGYFTPPGIGIVGGVNLSSPDEGDNVFSFGGGASYSLPETLPVIPTGLYTCPFASAYVTTGDNSGVTVPIGIGVATIVSLGETMTLSPYVQPQIRWSSFDDVTDTDWWLSAGANIIGFLGPRLYAGVTVNRVFVDDAESVLGLKFGMTF